MPYAVGTRVKVITQIDQLEPGDFVEIRGYDADDDNLPYWIAPVTHPDNCFWIETEALESCSNDTGNGDIPSLI